MRKEPSLAPVLADASYVDPAIGGECRTHGADRAIAALADRQHGVVARRQLLALGIGGGAIDVRVGRGRLHPVHRGVYSVGHNVLGAHGRWMAAVLAGGAAAVLSHRSAGSLWGVLPRGRHAVEVTRPTSARVRPGIRCHQSALPRDECAIVNGIAVTSVPRMALDLAATVSKRRLENVLNEIEVQQLRDALSIPDLLERYPGRSGSMTLREILGDRAATQGVTRRQLEERFASLLEGTDLPKPRRNADIAVAGRFFEVDCLWAAQRLIVELDGRAVHGTARAFERDRERDRLLIADGWRVVRITWRQLRDDAPAVLADLRRLLRAHPQPPTL